MDGDFHSGVWHALPVAEIDVIPDNDLASNFENQLSFSSQTDFLDDQIQKLHSPLVVFPAASLHFSADFSDCIAFLCLVSYILNFKIPHSPLTLYTMTYIISYPSS